MKYLVNSNINHNGKPYVKGDSIDLSDLEAKNLLQAGAISLENSEVLQDSEGESKMVEPKKRGPKPKES